MTWTYYVDPDLRIVFILEFHGFSFSELPALYQTIFADPLYRQGMDICFDLRQVNFTDKDKYDFKFLSTLSSTINSDVDQRLGECKLAVTVNTAEDYKLIHQWLVTLRMTSSPVERHLFQDYSTAREWLGVPEGYEIKYP
jgi:hypothetical protein|tara:strand:+ start:12820 stop:13239 length:420 start_codon:yes stop_codon:yes gene_type:complete